VRQKRGAEPPPLTAPRPKMSRHTYLYLPTVRLVACYEVTLTFTLTRYGLLVVSSALSLMKLYQLERLFRFKQNVAMIIVIIIMMMMMMMIIIIIKTL
jgi:hypothetical protein